MQTRRNDKCNSESEAKLDDKKGLASGKRSQPTPVDR